MIAVTLALLFLLVAIILRRARKIKERNDEIYRRQLWEVRRNSEP